MPTPTVPDVHDGRPTPPSEISQRLAAALIDNQINPTDLGLAEVELRYHGKGRVVERISAYGEFCPLVVRKVTDHYLGPEAPHCPHLSGLSENSHVLEGIGGTYIAPDGQAPTGPASRFAYLDDEPELLSHATAALDHLDIARAAARASARLDRLGHVQQQPPELSR